MAYECCKNTPKYRIQVIERYTLIIELQNRTDIFDDIFGVPSNSFIYENYCCFSVTNSCVNLAWLDFFGEVSVDMVFFLGKMEPETRPKTI